MKCRIIWQGHRVVINPVAMEPPAVSIPDNFPLHGIVKVYELLLRSLNDIDLNNILYDFVSIIRHISSVVRIPWKVSPIRKYVTARIYIAMKLYGVTTASGLVLALSCGVPFWAHSYHEVFTKQMPTNNLTTDHQPFPKDTPHQMSFQSLCYFGRILYVTGFRTSPASFATAGEWRNCSTLQNRNESPRCRNSPPRAFWRWTLGFRWRTETGSRKAVCLVVTAMPSDRWSCWHFQGIGSFVSDELASCSEILRNHAPLLMLSNNPCASLRIAASREDLWSSNTDNDARTSMGLEKHGYL